MALRLVAVFALIATVSAAAPAAMLDVAEEDEPEVPRKLSEVPAAPAPQVVIVQVPAAPVHTHSKFWLVVVESLALGTLGIDRCCMGDCCTGFLKFFTAGGFGIWALFDYCSVMWNAITGDDHLPYFFKEDGVWEGNGVVAQIIAILCILLNCGCCCFGLLRVGGAPMGAMMGGAGFSRLNDQPNEANA